ncbi:MAG: alpha/beta hydrolase [Opitutales bacterium TMED158]|nr:MAG: alpha/beta hydrolase [Opitutales bacterium TMED158]
MPLPKPVLLVATFFMGTVLLAQNESDWKALYEPYADDEMPYRLMKPAGYNASESYPVIVSLHGGGGRGADNQKQLKIWNQQLADTQLRKKFPCYVLAPQAAELWGANHLKKIQAIIAALPSVDADRIYMLGHSMGGHGTNILIQIAPSYFAAIAPSAGTGRTDDNDFIEAAIIKDIPTWAFHGDEDTVCPYGPQATLFSEMKALRGNMKLTTFAGDGHGISGKFIPGAGNGITTLSSERCDPEPDFMTWLFKQKRSK